MRRKIAIRDGTNAASAYPMTRRGALATAVMAGTAMLVGVRSALADLAEATAEIETFSAGRKALPGRITIGLPEIAENGNSVPLSVVVDSPMTTEDHVTEVLLIAERNPRPVIATFRFTPMMGRAQASTRIRLAATQNVTVLAKTSRGGLLIGQRSVKVTIGGCGG
jgi:sulfur-oxidizing protein SoxY